MEQETGSPLNLTFQRELMLAPPMSSGLPEFLTAASGLVRLGRSFYVIADDELGLACFSADGSQPGVLLPLFEGQVEGGHAEWKKRKPDLEALTLLPRADFAPFGALLALPSGSRENRVRGSLVTLGRSEEPEPAPLGVDFSLLYRKLAAELPELNIEGAVVQGPCLKLFQRGNGGSGCNAVIDLSLERMFSDLRAHRPLSDGLIEKITVVDLGQLNGVPLGFTDAALFRGREIGFLAAAERTDSTYEDGEYVGAVLGRLEEGGVVAGLQELPCPQKPEGLWFESGERGREFFVVTDADSPSRPSVLYRGSAPWA